MKENVTTATTNITIPAIIQATSPSALFPGKSLVEVAGKTVLEHIVERLGNAECVGDIILATSTLDADDTLAAEAKRLKIKVYRGSDADVISRLCGAAETVDEETVLKVNGNYPLVDTFLADELIKEHMAGGFDYSYNEHLAGVPYGTGCEVVSKEKLLEINAEELTSEERETGSLYFRQNEDRFKVGKFAYGEPRPHYKLCFDTEKDLKLIRFIFGNLNKPFTEEIIRLLDDNPVLAESNRYESVQEVGIEKLYLFPDKIAAIAGNACEGSDLTYPISVELSLTNRCNFNCLWCSDKDLRVRESGDLDFDVAKRLFSDLKEGGTKGIVIEGGGEPTLHKSFTDIVDLACEMDLGVGLITNGSVPISRETADKFEWVRVSLDASNAEEQRRLKKSDTFEKVMSNIKNLCESKTTVGIGYVVTSDNLGSLDPLILRLSDFGAKYIQFRPVIDHPELDVKTDLSYLKRYENTNFSVIIDGMQQNLLEGNSNLPCTAHSLTTVITADGNVYLCGRLNIYEWFKPMGNINDKSFRDIWTGEKRLEQSRMVLDPKFCGEHCPRCRLTKFNRLFGRLDKTKSKNFI